MTSSAGASGLIFVASPPRSTTASRMVARSTTAGTPVKSCITTRAGVNWISVSGSAAGSQFATASIWADVTFAPSSVRSRFSSRILRLNGSSVGAVHGGEREVVEVGPLERPCGLRSCPCSALARCSSPRRRIYLDVKIPPGSPPTHTRRGGPVDRSAEDRVGRCGRQGERCMDAVRSAGWHGVRVAPAWLYALVARDRRGRRRRPHRPPRDRRPDRHRPRDHPHRLRAGGRSAVSCSTGCRSRSS